MNKQMQPCGFRLVETDLNDNNSDLIGYRSGNSSLFLTWVIKVFTILLLSFSATLLKAQIPPAPLNSIGPWNNPSGPYITTALYNSGIGTVTPEGKLEVKYQPCSSQQNGLVVTSLACPYTQSNTSVYNPLRIDAFNIYPGDPNLPMPSTPLLSFSPAFAVTSSTLPVINLNDMPMFWVRDENPAGYPIPFGGNTTMTTYDTKFIIMNNGNTGINTSNPRGTLDVVQFGVSSSNTPTAVFGKLAAGTQTLFLLVLMKQGHQFQLI